MYWCRFFVLVEVILRTLDTGMYSLMYILIFYRPFESLIEAGQVSFLHPSLFWDINTSLRQTDITTVLYEEQLDLFVPSGKRQPIFSSVHTLLPSYSLPVWLLQEECRHLWCVGCRMWNLYTLGAKDCFHSCGQKWFRGAARFAGMRGSRGLSITSQSSGVQEEWVTGLMWHQNFQNIDLKH